MPINGFWSASQGQKIRGAQGAHAPPVFLDSNKAFEVFLQHDLSTLVHTQILAPCAVPVHTMPSRDECKNEVSQFLHDDDEV